MKPIIQPIQDIQQTNFYAFFAGFGDMATCLFAIQSLSDSGAFADYPELEQMLRVFQQSTLMKLYFRALGILEEVDGIVIPPGSLPFGDFEGLDFADYDFDDGYFQGDFLALDYTNDFLLSYVDQTNTGFSSLFQTILNILTELQRQVAQISSADIISLDDALVEAIGAFQAIQAYLITLGLSPCLPPATLYLNNSADIYLQAAGADGSDGVAEGVHLRWSLAGDIGLNHVPKGDYDDSIATPALYNQPDDFVHIYRTPYATPVSFTIDFTAVAPSINYAAREWTYFINSMITGQLLTSQVTLTFTDADQYTQIAVNTDPTTDYPDFLSAYSGVIQLAVVNKAMFRAGVNVVSTLGTDTNVKLEAQCTADMSDASAGQMLARETAAVPAGQTQAVSILAENITALGVLTDTGCYVQSFTFETYNDFQASLTEDDWTEIGDGYSLSLVDQDVFDALETDAYPINELWPQYNEGTTVKVANYQDKWSIDNTNDPSIKTVVTQYLSLSETDPRAMQTLDSTSLSYPDPAGLQISLVDVLNIISTDFHIARMLGLGAIDTISDDGQYVYRMTYTNQNSLTNPSPLARTYMTLPTGLADNRLPLQPQIRPVEYGLPVVNTTVSTAFDADGYASSGINRAINIGRQLFSDEVAGYDFFADLTTEDNTNVFVNSRPISYGIKYRPADQPDYTKPEITQSKSFGVEYYAYDPDFPVTGVPETVPVPDNPTSLYIHLETQTGVHYYAIYGMNWFSRASVISAEVATDDTEFPLQNRLQPPPNVAVQYIQQESPLIFTTTQEQTWLAGRAAAFPGQDINFTRIVFSWIDITDITSLPDTTPASLATAIRPDNINVFFDPNLPVEVQGMIQSISPVAGQDNQLQLFTAPYTQIDGTVLSPAIDSSAFFRFNNSLLSTPQGQFGVLSIVQGTTGPVITVSQIIQNAAQEDPQNPGSYGLVQTFQSPLAGSQFSMVENLSNAANWQPVTEGISLYSFADPDNPVIETYTDSEGNVTMNWIGGLTAGAVITPLFTGDPQTDLPGYYQLQFAEALTPNPQINIPFDPNNPDNNAPGALHPAHVEWYQGWCRMATVSGDEVKLVQASRIVQTSPLSLIVYDPGYATDPIQASASPDDTVQVNFHPGYRAYLFPEPAPGTFNGANILPPANQSSLKTLIGLQSADTSPGGSGFTSSVSSPAVLLARLIVEPVQLPAPTAASYVVRPDATYLAAFTFDTAIPPLSDGSAASPFGFKFCRTTAEDVLYALYQDTTVTAILADLAALTTDNSYNQRYYELVNVIFDPANPGAFNVFDASPQPYGFPVPDLVSPPEGATPDVLQQQYSLAIQGTILPLTATTPTFVFIKTGLQTDNSQPAIRDANGNLLDPSSPAFNPFPMVRKYTLDSAPNTTYIRFTDYNLNAASRDLYFYAVAEVTNQLQTGPLSLFTGPVTIVNTMPPEPPIIRTFSIVPSAAGVTSPISLEFQVSPTAPYDNITAMRFYRTPDLLLTAALATMGTPVEVPASDPDQMGYTLTDTLSDFAYLPVGAPLYYRLASIRSIINELGLPEEVVSIGSDVITVNLIDTVNPTAPTLTYTPGTDTNGTINWTTVVNNGTYYLYQQNASGNWTLLDTDQTVQPGLPVVYPLTQALAPTDASGNAIYYRFKVSVQNASGLFNLTDNILTV